jgi:hypothetical protein
MEEISKTLVSNSTLTLFIAQEDFNTYIRHETSNLTYCNGFEKRIARQQLGKHLPLVLHDKNGESIVVANVTVRC